MMNRIFFESQMSAANSEMLKGGPELIYWTGFTIGLQRRYHGERFLTSAAHYAGLHGKGSMADGYRDGYNGPCDWSKSAKAVRILRNWHGWSTVDLGNMLGRSGRTIEGWEAGRTIPPAALAALKRLHDPIPIDQHNAPST
jgi:DNA-binding transcriptional regulator YiaG